MNRRALLKLFIGSVAVATFPIPKFLIKEEKPIDNSSYGNWNSTDFESSGVLTQEMIENAAIKSAENFGAAELIYISKKDYKTFARYFGYQVIYTDDDDIVHIKHGN